MPSWDPFYTLDDPSWNKKELGYILDRREVLINSLMAGFPSKAKGYQLLYVTRDVHDRPAHSVTTIIVPENARTDRLISLQAAYDSPDVNCSPSYGLQLGSVGPAMAWNVVDLTFILPFVRPGGPVLNIPDYEGSNAAFTVGPQSAYHILGSLRAALQTEDKTGLKSNAKTVMFGYSGGAYATEWAAELKKEYANELKIAGAAIGGAPPNIPNTYIYTNGTIDAALNVWGLLGVMNAYPEREISSHSSRRSSLSLGVVAAAALDRGEDQPPDFAFRNISSFFEHGDSFLYEFRHILDRVGVLGKRGSPDFPIFMYQGTKDYIIDPIKDTHKLIRYHCMNNASVRYRQFPDKGHLQVLTAGGCYAWTWMTNIFNGMIPSGCREDKDLNPGQDGSGRGPILCNLWQKIGRHGLYGNGFFFGHVPDPNASGTVIACCW